MERRFWVGIDVGGTFTDIVTYDEVNQKLESGKSPSTPDDPSRGVLAALRALAVPLDAVQRFCHGATVATNTALERRGAALGVLTTAGFRDVLVVGRGNRTQLYDIKAQRAQGLVKRSRILEVDERIAADGSVRVPLDEAAVARAAEHFGSMGVEAIAVCFIHAYADPSHEQRAAAILRQALPDVLVCCSSDVLAEHREYDRFATAALNAYVGPKMAHYLTELESRLAAGGLPVAPEIMSSSGGSWSLSRMASLPVNSMLSGPAAGVIGAIDVATELGVADLVTYDMGGTSTDVALIRGGRYALSMEGAVGGFPNRAPQIEINTVGAGGGSVAYLDEGGFLNVGPRSSGAQPGPACYGHGGLEATVTDANVVLGRFRPAAPLGGEIAIDHRAAEAVIDDIAAKLGLDRLATAEGIVRIANTRMTSAIKEISVMRGIDPRDLSLFAYGGAGPLHAAAIAEELGMSRVIVPAMCGAFSAYGLLVAGRRLDFARTQLMPLETVSVREINDQFALLEAEANAAFEAEGFEARDIRYERAVDMRYEGQAFELMTPCPNDLSGVAELVAAFHAAYEERYSHADDGAVEAVCFRLSAFLPSPKLESRVEPSAGSSESVSNRTINFDGVAIEARAYQRESLAVGETVTGPAIIDERGSATLVPPAVSATVHESGALILQIGAKS